MINASCLYPSPLQFCFQAPASKWDCPVCNKLATHHSIYSGAQMSNMLLVVKQAAFFISELALLTIKQMYNAIGDHGL